MKKILIDFKTLVIELVTLVIGLLWATNSHWNYEPMLVVIISGLGIFFFTVFKLYSEKEDRPRIELELELHHKIKKTPFTTNNSPINIDGRHAFIDNGKYMYKIEWTYSLKIRNNSTVNAYDVKLWGDRNYPHLFSEKKHKPLVPILINQPVDLKLEYKIHQEMTKKVADELNSQRFPEVMKKFEILVEYKDENRRKVYYGLFKAPHENHDLNPRVGKKTIKRLSEL